MFSIMGINIPTYKPCIISNPKKRIVYVRMHPENHETGELSDCDGYYPKEIDNYHLNQVGLFIKHSKEDIKRLEDMCKSYNRPSLKIINPSESQDYKKPISGKTSFVEYLRQNSKNILNPINFVLIYNDESVHPIKIIPYHKKEILSSNSEDKVIEWSKDIVDPKYYEKSIKSLSELLRFYQSLKDKEELFQLPLEWTPYAS